MVDPAITCAALLAGLTLAGFGTGGIAAGSLAAMWQAAIGNVAAGSFFAMLQSFGATGWLLKGSTFCAAMAFANANANGEGPKEEAFEDFAKGVNEEADAINILVMEIQKKMKNLESDLISSDSETQRKQSTIIKQEIEAAQRKTEQLQSLFETTRGLTKDFEVEGVYKELVIPALETKMKSVGDNLNRTSEYLGRLMSPQKEAFEDFAKGVNEEADAINIFVMEIQKKMRNLEGDLTASDPENRKEEFAFIKQEIEVAQRKTDELRSLFETTLGVTKDLDVEGVYKELLIPALETKMKSVGDNLNLTSLYLVRLASTMPT